MIPTHFTELITILTNSTNKDSIKWNRLSDDRYKLSTNKATVEISRQLDEVNDEYYFLFSFFNVSLAKVITFTISYGDADFATMEQLFKEAELSALNLRSSINDFINDIKV